MNLSHTATPKTSRDLYTSIRHIYHDTSSTVAMSNPELASSYAALILADDGVDITV
jgi:hypothetical protein